MRLLLTKRKRIILRDFFGYSTTSTFFLCLSSSVAKLSLNPPDHSTFGNYSKGTEDDWRNILRFSAKWGFDEVKELAVRNLQPIDIGIISRIQLYQENLVAEKYLFPLYVKLAKRDRLIGIDEGRALSTDTLVLVLQARERLRGQVSKDLSPIPKDLKQNDIIDIVASTFNLSLKDLNLPGI